MRMDFTISRCANRNAKFLMNAVRTVIRQNGAVKKTPPVFHRPAANALFMPQQTEACISIHYLLRQQNAVDNMDHAVGGGDVGGRDIGAIDAHLAAFDHDLHGLTLYGLGLCELDDISRLH